jgi:hypothetical protein
MLPGPVGVYQAESPGTGGVATVAVASVVTVTVVGATQAESPGDVVSAAMAGVARPIPVTVRASTASVHRIVWRMKWFPSNDVLGRLPGLILPSPAATLPPGFVLAVDETEWEEEMR